MPTFIEAVREKLRRYGQEHLLAWYDQLDDAERQSLLEQVSALDLVALRNLFDDRDKVFTLPAPERIQPIPVVALGADDREAGRIGEEVLRHGKVAVLLVAGGQASRLGFDHPKGMFPIGPVSKKTLFQIHAEKVLALSRRHGRSIPFLVMTSPATHEETGAFFEENHYFGLPAEDVFFFRQGTMPALDLKTGKLLLESPGRLFTSPNGHGGTLRALADAGLLDKLRSQGIEHVFYFQVDNPLVKVADPAFLGRHVEARAEVSSKVVAKESPTDKLGNLVLVEGRCSMIEYSDLPEDLARQTEGNGRLRIWAGSPAIHVFDIGFLTRVMQERTSLPFHVARKKVPCLNEAGQLVQPEKENALKFEMFIFDVLPLAQRWAVVETSRTEEFMPLKSATGPDSPETVRQAITNLAANWLERAGVKVPKQANGFAAFPLEISPLFALDAEELARKIDRSINIQGPLYIQARPSKTQGVPPPPGP
jgi:UDP-N-acetylglucosamine/UDP-N-acetylgalactosamine diphosphorylase